MKATVKAKHDRFADVSLVFFGFLPSFFSVLVLIETADLLLYSSIRFFF